MSATPSIEGLANLANRLKGITFPDEGDHIAQIIFERASIGEIHNCHPRTGSSGVEVRFYLGGAQRTIGYTDDPTAAARFADMARIRFHRYRKRGGNTTFDDAGMNINLHQAMIDAEEIPEAVALLDDIEHLLLATGAIYAPGTGPVEPLKPRAARPTQRGDILAMLKAIDARLGRIETFIVLSQGDSAMPLTFTRGSQRLSGCEGD